MSDFTVTRIFEDDHCTLGAITWPGMERTPLACLELPWRDNAIGVSRIPAGEYPFITWHSPTFKRPVLRLDDDAVAPRSAILFHPGNWPSQIRGCFCPGFQYADWRSRGEWLGVGSSTTALGWLMDAVGDSGVVKVRDAF